MSEYDTINMDNNFPEDKAEEIEEVVQAEEPVQPVTPEIKNTAKKTSK